MATVIRVVDNDPNSAWYSEQPNQYASLLNQVLGITDYDADNLGRLVIPHNTGISGGAFPTTPSQAMMYLRTDLGTTLGKLHIRDGASNWVPYMTVRQTVKSAELTANVTVDSQTMRDIPGLSATLTTTGGRLRIRLVPSTTVQAIQGVLVRSSGGGNPYSQGYFTIKVNNFVLAPVLSGITWSANFTQIYAPPSGFIWDYAAVAGTYTITFQAAIFDVGGLLTFLTGLALEVDELGEQ